MTQTINEAESLSKLLTIKSQLEQSIENVGHERDQLKWKLKETITSIGIVKQERDAELNNLYQLKIDSIDLNATVDLIARRIQNQINTIQSLEKKVSASVRLDGLEETLSKVRDSTEHAMNFYSEDSLQLELMNKQEELKQKRVELHNLTAEYETKKAYIEARRIAAEEEKRQLLEEQKKKENEDLMATEEAINFSVKEEDDNSQLSSTSSTKLLRFGPIDFTALTQLTRW